MYTFSIIIYVHRVYLYIYYMHIYTHCTFKNNKLVFVLDRPLQPIVAFVSMAGAYASEAPSS